MTCGLIHLKLAEQNDEVCYVNCVKGGCSPAAVELFGLKFKFTTGMCFSLHGRSPAVFIKLEINIWSRSESFQENMHPGDV